MAGRRSRHAINGQRGGTWAGLRLLEARRGFQAMLSARLGGGGPHTGDDDAGGAGGEGLPAATAAVVGAAALFERLLPAADASMGGLGAAAAVYEQALAAAPLAVSPIIVKGVKQFTLGQALRAGLGYSCGHL